MAVMAVYILIAISYRLFNIYIIGYITDICISAISTA